MHKVDLILLLMALIVQFLMGQMKKNFFSYFLVALPDEFRNCFMLNFFKLPQSYIGEHFSHIVDN